MTTKLRVRKGRSETPRLPVEGKTELNVANGSGGVKRSTPALAPMYTRPNTSRLVRAATKELGPLQRKSISFHRDQWKVIQMLASGLRTDVPMLFETAICVLHAVLGHGLAKTCIPHTGRRETWREILKDVPELIAKETEAYRADSQKRKEAVFGPARHIPDRTPAENAGPALTEETGIESLELVNFTKSLTFVCCPNEHCEGAWFEVTGDFRIAEGAIFAHCECGETFEIRSKDTAQAPMRRGA